MVMSGFAALGYQIVWTQQASLWLGHESAAVLAVVAAFFGGVGIGALLLGGPIRRSARPGRWYAASEVVMAGWSVALALMLDHLTPLMLSLIGPEPTPGWHWCVAFAGTLVLLLPATMAMGATLPAMEAVLGGQPDGGRDIATLYAANTLGAMFGVVAAAFLLVPAIGLMLTAGLCASLNLASAALALRLPDPLPPADVLDAVRTRGSSPLAALAVTGLLGIGYEVVAVRVLSQITENTVYTFALVLAVYLGGTAAGAAIFGRLVISRFARYVPWDRIFLATALACVAGGAGLWLAPVVSDFLAHRVGPGIGAALTIEAALAALAFLLPCLSMGALFSFLASTARGAGHDLGRVVAVNTLGAAAAPVVFGVLLAGMVSPGRAIVMLVAGYLLLATRTRWRAPITWVAVAGAAALWVHAPSLIAVDLPPGGRVLASFDGPLASVTVLEDAMGVATLRINNRQQEGSSATLVGDARQGILPILLHPDPHSALFLGLGTGVTAGMAARDPGLRVLAVELLPEVISASGHFTRLLAERFPGAGPEVIHADARRYVRSADARFDVIVSDNFHPARSGSAALYTVEHFAAVRGRLAPGGLFCQWLPLHQMDRDTLRSIVASFVAVYPRAWLMLATNSLETPVLGLVSNRDGEPLDLARARARMAGVRLPGGPGAFGIADEFALLGGFIGGPTALARFSQGAPRNTDDRPLVAYRAPSATYAPENAPVDRLLGLLSELRIEPGELLGEAGTEGGSVATATRLRRYWQARDRFLHAGRGIEPTADARAMLERVREPLLDVVRLSADFRPAYDPLLRLAAGLANQDVAAAVALLQELRESSPARPEAAALLAQLQRGALQR
jgi:spermidine synthase